MSYTYIAVRKDIPVPDQVCQIAHAGISAGIGFHEEHSVTETGNLVVLEVKDKSELIKLAEHLENNDVEYTLVCEPDNGMGFTSLATRPMFDSERKLLRRNRLWCAPK